MFFRRRALGAAAVLMSSFVALAGCSVPDQNQAQYPWRAVQQETARLKIAVTFPAVQFLVAAIGQERVEVRDLSETAYKPHVLQLSEATIVWLNQADILFASGGGVQPKLREVSGGPLRQRTVTFADELTLPPAVLSWQDYDLNDAEPYPDQSQVLSQEEITPNFWLDVQQMTAAVTVVRDALIAADPESKAFFTEHAEALKVALARLENQYQNALAPCRGALVITNHQGISYLAQRYDLDLLTVWGLTSHGDISEKTLTGIQQAAYGKTAAIFFSARTPPDVQFEAAQATALPVGVLDTVEGDAPYAGQADYLKIMYQNLAELRKSLACSR